MRVIRGAILDVAVDLRRDAPTFGQHVTAELSAENWQQMVIPEGFAHAFCSLEADTEVLYKVSDFWEPDHERGLLWNDPELAIDWPVEGTAAHLNERDLQFPPLAEVTDLF